MRCAAPTDTSSVGSKLIPMRLSSSQTAFRRRIVEACEELASDASYRYAMPREGVDEAARLQRELQRLEVRMSEVREALQLHEGGEGPSFNAP